MRAGGGCRGPKWAILGWLAIGLPVTGSAHPSSDERIAAVSARIAASPRDQELRLARAALLRRAGHLHDALADLSLIARRDPHDPAMRIERGLVRIAQGRPRAAERDLDAAIAAGSTSVTAYWERAKLREADGRLDAAREDLDAAIAGGGTPDLYLDRARVDAARGDLQAAAEGLAEGCAALSDPVVLRLALVQAERRRDRPDRALAITDALLDTVPQHADWVLLRAEILAELGRPDEALADRLRALAFANATLATRPTAMHRLSRARVYLALELPAAALVDLERVASIMPDVPEAQSLLLRAKEALG